MLQVWTSVQHTNILHLCVRRYGLGARLMQILSINQNLIVQVTTIPRQNTQNSRSIVVPRSGSGSWILLKSEQKPGQNSRWNVMCPRGSQDRTLGSLHLAFPIINGGMFNRHQTQRYALNAWFLKFAIITISLRHKYTIFKNRLALYSWFTVLFPATIISCLAWIPEYNLKLRYSRTVYSNTRDYNLLNLHKICSGPKTRSPRLFDCLNHLYIIYFRNKITHLFWCFWLYWYSPFPLSGRALPIISILDWSTHPTGY